MIDANHSVDNEATNMTKRALYPLPQTIIKDRETGRTITIEDLDHACRDQYGRQAFYDPTEDCCVLLETIFNSKPWGYDVSLVKPGGWE